MSTPPNINVSNTPSRRRTLTPAVIEWQQDRPYTPAFGDIYYSSNDQQILDEIDHVFLKPNQIQSRLAALLLRHQQADPNAPLFFGIGELGFGTGLNFITTVKHYLELRQQMGLAVSLQAPTLHFISFEKHPLACEDQARVNHQQRSLFPDLASLIDNLWQNMPPAVEGIHRISFAEHAVQLTLVYGDINHSITQLSLHFGKLDAWFFDGFSPQKNPQMWQPSLFKAIAKLSKEGTTYATFTAAKIVKEGLIAGGFTIKKIAGFGRKRDMLCGRLATAITQRHTFTSDAPAAAKPWLFSAKPYTPCSDITVIGGGLAGTATAYSLAKRGATVTLIERHAQLAQEASGNAVAALFTKFSPFDTPQNRFYQYAYFDAITHLNELERCHPKVWSASGVIQLAYDDAEKKRQSALIKSQAWPSSVVAAVDAKAIESICGFAVNEDGLWLPNAGWAHPPLVCQVRAKQPNIQLITRSHALELKHTGNQHWEIMGADGTVIATSPAVVIANAADARAFLLSAHLPLKTIRGQITYLPATAASDSLRSVICYEGYTTPSFEGSHTIGASFHPKSSDLLIRAEDHIDNLSKMANTIPQFAETLQLSSQPHILNHPIDGRTAFRCQTPDYLPVVGPLPNEEAFWRDFKALEKGNPHTKYPKGEYHPNLYINVAHGSRGLTTTHFSAELIASYITGEPANMDQAIIEALHPSRFIIRRIRRIRSNN